MVPSLSFLHMLRVIAACSVTPRMEKKTKGGMVGARFHVDVALYIFLPCKMLHVAVIYKVRAVLHVGHYVS